MRSIPGTEEVAGRGFGYLESSSPEAFKTLFPKIATYGESPLPSAGGALNEDFELRLPNGLRMFALSYKGDLEGWNRKIMECADALDLNYADISDRSLVLRGNEAVALDNCETIDHRVGT